MAKSTGWPVWYELMSADPQGVAPFYKAVLGWDIPAEGMQMPTGSEYRAIGRADGGQIGGLLTLTPDMLEMGMAPGWLPYFHAAPVDEVAEKVWEAGGSVPLPPMDIPQAGRLAMMADPQGAHFYVIDPQPPEDQPDAQSDVFSTSVPGRCGWNQLDTSDAPAASRFYRALFDWNTDQMMPMGPAGDYRFIEMDGTQIGAFNPMKPEDVPPNWLPFFRVADVDAALAAAGETGGTIVQQIHEVPSGDSIFVAIDPAGARLGLVGPRGE